MIFQACAWQTTCPKADRLSFCGLEEMERNPSRPWTDTTRRTRRGDACPTKKRGEGCSVGRRRRRRRSRPRLQVPPPPATHPCSSFSAEYTSPNSLSHSCRCSLVGAAAGRKRSNGSPERWPGSTGQLPRDWRECRRMPPPHPKAFVDHLWTLSIYLFICSNIFLMSNAFRSTWLLRPRRPRR